MRISRLFVSAMAVAAVTSCAATYQDLDPSLPGATLSIQRNELGTQRKDDPMQGYALVDNDQCDNYQRLAGFSFDREIASTRRVGAGEPINIFAHSATTYQSGVYQTSTYSTVGVGYNWCYSLASFTPVENRDYIVTQDGDPAVGCQLVVLDKMTGEAPADLVIRRGFQCPKD